MGLSAAPPASADQLSTLRAQAQAVEAHIQSLGQQEAALAEKYDGAVLAADQAQAKVAAAAATLSAAQAAADRARAVLGTAAVDAYTGASTAPSLGGAGTLGTTTAGLVGAEYVNSVEGVQQDALDSYRLASVQAKTAQAQLQQAQSAAQAQVQKVAAARTSVKATENQLQGVENQTQGQIATLVAQIQAQQAAAAAAAAAAAQQAAAAAAAAAQQAAAARAAQAKQAQQVQVVAASPSAVTAGAAAPVAAVAEAPSPRPAGAGASGALQAALSRVGDPYVWGASGPNSFDCSGLTMWAYGQVGISLPHYSGAQYSAGTHIPMSDLQPGDLVFFSDPGEHVAMYAGHGDIVEAPHSGANVRVIPMYSDFVQAVRIG